MSNQEIEPQHHASHKPYSQEFTQFLQELEALSDVEKKLERAVTFMEFAISQQGSPHFKEFWDAKKICLDLFKENINPSIRMANWTKYSELCREARSLQEIFDEQSAFAVEQIEMAIKAMEEDFEQFSTLLEKAPDSILSRECTTTVSHYDQYNTFQKELNLLNSYATRSNTLRKELLHTEMRISQKNKLFHRLSILGDKIFPRRKMLMYELSQLFLKDVEHFIETTFAGELSTQALFDVREEIKALQSFAKMVTLTTEVFSQTRARLSECWDSIKNVLKERKRESSEKRAVFKKHRDEVAQELASIQSRIEAQEITDEEATKKLDDVIHHMKRLSLGKYEVKELREKIRAIQNVLSERQRRVVADKKATREKKLKERQDCFITLKQKIDDALKKEFEESLCAALVEEVYAACNQSLLLPLQEEELTFLAARIQDRIVEHKEEGKQSLEELRQILRERKKRFAACKAQLESLRRAQGSSGLDFSEALHYNDLVAQERERLAHIENGITEIEEKIEACTE